MKKAVAILIVLLSLGLAVAAVSRSIGMRQSNVPINVKSLPEDGLSIVSASDPAFDAEVSGLLKEKRPELDYYVQSAKPFCVFLKNTGDRRVVGFNLRWEVTKQDGKVVTRGISYSSPSALLGAAAPTDAMLADAGYNIAPGQGRFLALDPSLTNLTYVGLYSKINADQQDVREHLEGLSAEYRQMLDSAVSITVSIDGAFFEDGTFVGPNKSGFFDQMQGLLDAKRDLAHLMEQDIKNNVSRERMFGRVAQAAQEAKVPDNLRHADSAPQESNQYKHAYAGSLRNFAAQILRIREKRGDDESIGETQRQVRQAVPKLQKKDSSD